MQDKPIKKNLARIFQYKMLGAQLAYLESIAGPAVHVNTDGTRDYEVDGCEVLVRSDGVSVVALRLFLNKECTFDPGRFYENRGNSSLSLPTANSTTFGIFASRFGSPAQRGYPGIKFLTPCGLCGNSQIPWVYLYAQEGHAENWLEWLVGADSNSQPTLNATDRLMKTMIAREGRAYEFDTKFNCDMKYDKLAVEVLKNVKVAFMEIGHNIKPTDVMDCPN